MGLFSKDTIEDKVKNKLVYDASRNKKTKVDDKLSKMLNNAKWKDAKLAYEAKRKEAVKKVADRMMQTFEDWNKTKRAMKRAKKSDDEISAEKKKMYDQESSDITDILNSYNGDIEAYIEAANKYKPKIGKQLSVDNQKESILTDATDDYAKRVKFQMELAKKLAKYYSFKLNSQFDADKASQEQANVPVKIEEKIDQAKELLDTLLGKIIAPALNPDLPEFDINTLIGIIKSFLNPVISTTMPLTAILGKIPILGDLIGLLGMLMGGSGSSTLTKEQLMEKFPEKPEVPPEPKQKVNSIISDITQFCMTLPTLLIQVVFSMLDLIYSKLKIIMSIIPLGNLFPLSLVPAALTATPKITQLIMVLPGMIGDLLWGILKDKFWEAMALANTSPYIDSSSLDALAEDIAEQKKAKRKSKKKLDYSDVTKKIFESQLSGNNYTMMQAKNVQKNYLQIFNCKGETPLKITQFVDNGKDQNLPYTGGIGITVGNYTLLGGDESEMEPGFTEKQLERKKPSVEDYEAYFNKLIAESTLSNGLNYDRIKSTQGVVGEWYLSLKGQLEKYGHDVVLHDVMHPAKDTWTQTFAQYIIPRSKVKQ